MLLLFLRFPPRLRDFRRFGVVIGVLLLIAAALLPLASSARKTASPAPSVALQYDRTLIQVNTQAAQPLAVLAEQGVAVGMYDRVYVNGQDFSPQALEQMAWNSPLYHIRVARSIEIALKDGDQIQTLYTTGADVGRALDGAGIDLFLGDHVSPGLETQVTEGMIIKITRSVPLTVLVDGRKLRTRAVGPTVGDALAEIGLAPLGLDYTLPTLDSPLKPGMMIEIIRVLDETNIYGKRSP